MMNKLKAKLKKQGGFTLVEMLIVVAIIAILIAVSIPMMMSALERAREATDEANERSAAGLGSVKYLSSLGASTGDTDYLDWGTDTEKTFNYVINGTQGTLDATATPTGYGMCEDHEGAYIIVTIKKDGTVSLAWSGTNTTPHITNPTP